MRLADALGSLGDRALTSFCDQRGVSIDASKRLPLAEQAARKLLTPPSLRTIEEWPEPLRRAMARLVAHRDGVPRSELSGGGFSLLESGLAFLVPGAPDRLVVPAEYRLQIPPSPVDSPRALRRLLPALDHETLHAIAGSLGIRMAATSRWLALAAMLEQLEPEIAIQKTIRSLPPRSLRLLAAIEARGDELSTDELLELERDPARYVGAPLPRRSVSHELLRRGLLLPTGAGIFALPSEVADVVARRRRAESEKDRGVVAQRVRAADRTPRRAEFGEDPGPTVAVLLASLRAQGVVLRPSAGAPRSAVAKAARAAGVDAEFGTFLVAVARAAGLFDTSARIDGVAAALFDAWRRSSAWDESREPADGFRAGPRIAAIPTPTRSLRDALLELLEALPSEAFTPVDEVIRVASRDLRAGSASAGLDRARRRALGAFVARPELALRSMMEVALPALGVVDRGRDESGELVRLSSRGRRLLAGEIVRAPVPASPAARWIGAGRVRVEPWASLRDLVAVAEAAEPFRGDGTTVLEITRATLARGVDRGFAGDDLRGTLERLVGSLDPTTEALFADLDRSRVSCAYVPASAYVPLTDPALRKALLDDPESIELFVRPAPDTGLLLDPEASPVSVRRLFRRHGIDLRIPKSRKA